MHSSARLAKFVAALALTLATTNGCSSEGPQGGKMEAGGMEKGKMEAGGMEKGKMEAGGMEKGKMEGSPK